MSYILLLPVAGVTLWLAGAIYFDIFQAGRWAVWGAAGWIVSVALMFAIWHPTWQPFLLLMWIFALFLGWWLSLKPSNERDWDPNSAVLPRAELSGDTIEFRNVRKTNYRSRTDFTTSYYDKQFHLSKLHAIDLLLYYWGSPWMSHPTLIFDFGDEGRVCVSVEVRFRRHEAYSFVRSIYRQQELIYQVTDETDAILLETVFSPDGDAYLYRLQVDAAEMRIALLDYANMIENLADSPRWYNGLTANCTTSIFRHEHNRAEWDWRMLINGLLDRVLYDRGRLDRSLPFDELKERSRINALAAEASQDRLGDYIRERLWPQPDANTSR